MKYVLLGAFSSGLLLYGIVLLYGALGTTHFAEMAVAIDAAGSVDGRLLVGLALVVAGLGFKLAAVPFHMWAPDVYQGAPMPITAYIAVGSKAAAFALVLRLFYEGLAPAYDQWQMLIAGMAALTMVFGNVVAIVQSNVKRMLAYSSVGQVGFLLMGVAAPFPAGVERAHGAPRGLLPDELRRVLRHHGLLQRDGQGRDPGLRGVGGAARPSSRRRSPSGCSR